jgi:hypothetical protein
MNAERTEANSDDSEVDHKYVEQKKTLRIFEWSIQTGRISRWNKGRTGMDMEDMEHL